MDRDRLADRVPDSVEDGKRAVGGEGGGAGTFRAEGEILGFFRDSSEEGGELFRLAASPRGLPGPGRDFSDFLAIQAKRRRRFSVYILM